MTDKKMLIMASENESRIAVVEDQLLQEMLIEHQSREQIKGNLYKARVVQIQTAVQAAFVDYGVKRHGFLPLSEVCPELVEGQETGARLKVGQQILVQVTREEVDNKGAAMTMNVSLPGRFMVFMPYGNKGGVSKKIEDRDERDRLKGFLSGLENEDHAAIIRTAGTGRDLSELKKDYTSVKKHWESIFKEFSKVRGPALLKEEEDVVTRTLRDYYSEDINEVWVDNPMVFQKALDFIKMADPRRQKILKLYVGDRSLFSTYAIERQVEQLTSREVRLPSGGSIVIDQTEALVAIDVNSGRSNQERNVDDTATRTNLEAAEEVARQLRLRNLGGLVVIDFIDMDKDKSRELVERRITESMLRDKAQHKILPISNFGLLEISRQRMAVRISNVVESPCPVCAGKGMVPSQLAATNLVLRFIRELAAKGNAVRVHGALPLELTNHLLNERRKELTELEEEFGIEVSITADPSLHSFDENYLSCVTDGPAKREPAPRTERGDSRPRGRRRDSEDGRPANNRNRPERTGRPERTPEPASEEETGNGETSEKETSRNDRGRGRGRGRSRDNSSDNSRRERAPRQEQESEVKAEPAISSGPDVDENFSFDTLPVADTGLQAVVPGESEMHKGAMFDQLNTHSEEALDKFFFDFQMRLKGKAGELPKPFPERYLWRTLIAPKEPTVLVIPPPRVVEETPAPEVAESSEGNEGSDAAVTEVAVEEKKKPASRGRRKKTVSTDDVAEATGEGVSETAEEEKPKPKRAPRSRSRKKPVAKETSEESTEGAEASESAESEAPKKPAAKRRAPRAAKKVATASKDAADSSEASEEPKTAEKPKRRAPAKRRTPRAKAAVDTNPEAS